MVVLSSAVLVGAGVCIIFLCCPNLRGVVEKFGVLTLLKDFLKPQIMMKQIEQEKIKVIIKLGDYAKNGPKWILTNL